MAFGGSARRELDRRAHIFSSPSFGSGTLASVRRVVESLAYKMSGFEGEGKGRRKGRRVKCEREAKMKHKIWLSCCLFLLRPGSACGALALFERSWGNHSHRKGLGPVLEPSLGEGKVSTQMKKACGTKKREEERNLSKCSDISRFPSERKQVDRMENI